MTMTLTQGALGIPPRTPQRKQFKEEEGNGGGRRDRDEATMPTAWRGDVGDFLQYFWGNIYKSRGGEKTATG